MDERVTAPGLLAERGGQPMTAAASLHAEVRHALIPEIT